MATAKQLAALAKARAARAKKAKTAAKKKPTKKVSVNAPSRATGKTPSKRLQSRRRKNVTPGYFPNPAKKKVAPAKTKIVNLLCAFKGGKRVAYWTGKHWDDEKSAAKCYSSQAAAAKAWNAASKYVSSTYKGGIVTEKK